MHYLVQVVELDTENPPGLNTGFEDVFDEMKLGRGLAYLPWTAHDDDGGEFPFQPAMNLPNQVPVMGGKFRQRMPFPPRVLSPQVLDQLGGQSHLREKELFAHGTGIVDHP
jgi:hypothetical protein